MSTVKDILHKRMKTKKTNYTDQTLLLYMCEKIRTEKVKIKNNHLYNKNKLKFQLNKNIKLCRMLQL